MFGYIMINKPELKIKDYEMYRSFYCGLCRDLKERYGLSGQASLTYDLTFVVLLLSGLYEPKGCKGLTRCAVQPVLPHPVRKNEFTEYAADMNILLTYYKCIDDWIDEKKLLRKGYADILHRKAASLSEKYPEKTKRIKACLNELSGYEKENVTDIDQVAGCFGHLLEEIFVCREDVWEQPLRRIGFYLGKFIYILDAYDDLDKDIRNGSYNPFAADASDEDLKDRVGEMLLLMMAEVSREFEKLPILKYGDILRNILYSGIWTGFEKKSGTSLRERFRRITRGQRRAAKSSKESK
ncbi:MAG: hypothetical protein IJX90_03535 [Blautia sp.]|nr:hypothetical protein [Blautia sp.]